MVVTKDVVETAVRIYGIHKILHYAVTIPFIPNDITNITTSEIGISCSDLLVMAYVVNGLNYEMKEDQKVYLHVEIFHKKLLIEEENY